MNRCRTSSSSATETEITNVTTSKGQTVATATLTWATSVPETSSKKAGEAARWCSFNNPPVKRWTSCDHSSRPYRTDFSAWTTAWNREAAQARYGDVVDWFDPVPQNTAREVNNQNWNPTQALNPQAAEFIPASNRPHDEPALAVEPAPRYEEPQPVPSYTDAMRAFNPQSEPQTSAVPSDPADSHQHTLSIQERWELESLPLETDSENSPSPIPVNRVLAAAHLDPNSSEYIFGMQQLRARVQICRERAAAAHEELLMGSGFADDASERSWEPNPNSIPESPQ